MMNEFRIELYIDSGEIRNTKLSNLDEKDINQWKTELEEKKREIKYKNTNEIVRN